jgi:hypothetical protein
MSQQETHHSRTLEPSERSGVAELAEFGYRRSEESLRLPTWAKYLIRLGAFVSEHRVPDRRLVVGVSVPTRAFAASLCALGVCTAVYKNLEATPRAHFDWLAKLQSGTRVRYRNGRYLFCGYLDGARKIKGNDFIAIRYDGVYLCPWYRCGDIVPLEPGEEFVRRRSLTTNPDFVAACLPGVDPWEYASRTSMDCLLVTLKETIRPEVLSEVFVTFAPPRTGVLNDLLRCDAFELNANDHDRTTVISAYSTEIPERMLTTLPPAIVFDGTAAYLRRRSTWRNCPSIVIIDRSEASAAPAADAFNQELAMSVADANLDHLGELPSGLEVCGFYEAIR